MAKASVPQTTARAANANVITAFDPYISKEDLLNQIIRNSVVPDIDAGQTFYVGQVLAILDNTDNDIDVRDVFYSQTDNFERITKGLSDHQYNYDKKFLLVHVPSFLTNSRSVINQSSKINYDNLSTKIRVEYHSEGRDTPEVGDLVKIQFRDKNSFYDPVVISVEKVKSQDITQKQIAAKQAIFCKIDVVSNDSKQGALDLSHVASPVGGYVQSLKQIDEIFSAEFVEGFKKTMIPYNPEISLKTTIRPIVEIDESAYVEFRDSSDYNNISLSTFSNNESKKYLIRVKDITSSPNDPQIRNKFYQYVKNTFETKLNYLVNIENDKSFTVDMRLNRLSFSTEPKLEDYIAKSKEIANSSPPTYYSPISLSDQQTPNTILKANKKPIKCENDISNLKEMYEIIPNKENIEKNLPKFPANNSDSTNASNNLNKWFDKKEADVNIFLQKKYLLLMSFLLNEQQLIEKNPEFYKKNLEDSSNYKTKNTYIGVQKVEKNLQNMSQFLSDLRLYVTSLESLPEKDVFVLPFNVVVPKPRQNITSENKDSNSRHFYGLAFDFCIFLRKNDKILKIPPDIAAMYVAKIGQLKNKKIGHGIFFGVQSYNHVEFLDNSGLSDVEISQRIFTRNKTDVEKMIETSNNKFPLLQQIIANNPNYKDIENKLAQKIQDLL